MAKKGQKTTMTTDTNAFPQEAPTRPDVPSVRPPAEIDIKAYRLAASMLWTWAVDGNKNKARSTTDPVYKIWVENRAGAKYSSCGDLGHGGLYFLGVRAHFINRAAFRVEHGGHGWRVGANLNLLVPPGVGQCEIAKPGRGYDAVPDVQAGDIIVISNAYGGHCMCVTGRDSDVINTAEYGQPGGAAKTHTLAVHGGILFVGSNQVLSWLPLPAALTLPGRVAPDISMIRRAQEATIGAVDVVPLA